MSEWIGRELERLRKLRGLRREEVAALAGLSASTIRNIEHDERYNISLDVLREIAGVLGATVKVSLETSDLNSGSAGGGEGVGEVSDAVTHPGAALSGETKIVTNDLFIRLIRDRYPACPLTNSQIGRRMWQFALSRGAQLVERRKQFRHRATDGDVGGAGASAGVGYRLPTVAAAYAVRATDLPALDRFADRLGRAYRDAKGRVFVPLV